jgi:hypothetical protein
VGDVAGALVSLTFRSIRHCSDQPVKRSIMSGKILAVPSKPLKRWWVQ